MRGAKSRPWLELRRPEHERTYLKHQVSTLIRLHPGDITVRWDRVPGPSFYDTFVARLQSDLLWPAYELLYPRDKREIPIQAFEATGLTGLAALWCDAGRRNGKRAEIRLRDCGATDAELLAWLRQLKVAAKITSPAENRFLLSWGERPAMFMARAIRPYVHPVKRPSLWPAKEPEQELYA